MDPSLRPQRRERDGLSAGVRSGHLDPVVVALLATAVCASGAARPSLWFDEAATISAATRSVPESWRLVQHLDAVHGLYYLVMHGWFALLPATEFFSRLSSCLATGVAAAGVVVLGRQLSTRTVAVCAGVVFAILPRVTWAGIEARSYALTAAAAVWMTVLLIRAVRRGTAALWSVYAVALTISTVLNVFLVLMVLAHAVAVATLAAPRSTAIKWAAASAAALVMVTPFLAFCRGQIAQVRWISPLGRHTFADVLGKQYFDHSVAFALAAWAVVAAVLLSSRLRTALSPDRAVVAIAVGWIVLPSAVLLGYSACSTPIYYPRYLTFTSPATALVLAVCLVALARTRERVVAGLVVFALAATPNYLLHQRGPYAKEGMDFSQVADVVTAHATPGDCLILDNTTNWAPGPIRPLTAARPEAYRNLVDPGLGVRATQRNRLWDSHLGIWGVADRVRRCTVLWTVSQRDESVPVRESGPGLDPGPRLRHAPAYQVPEAMGFHIVERWQFNFAQVVKSTR